ncbi:MULTISPECIES: SH3 domain-containing protein [unclassified Streptomyces]|uniref:SH3 domain-containing protein n=1 Tax=unclassified Streptomyces TaxID=2593676 RepID=UPI000DC7EAB6|nr:MULTISPECIES: SH3 domain-containing protein [unclassified Streptomyces]AWZ07896.1 SH3 domain-containing protein [Streptomyces sp. ICC4]AWZ15592.1 SH3 domain-containing protein [Streptomyces sp. ICC1]
MVKKALLTYALAAGVLIGPLGTAGWAADGRGSGHAAESRPVGVVESRTALNVREKPTVYSDVVKKLHPNARVLLSCQKRGGWVDGNPVWYRLHGSKGWVSARYVHNLQPVRPC